MPLKFYKPVTPGRRGASVIDYRAELTRGKEPEKKLLERLPASGGRNNHGRITNRAMATRGLRRMYRIIDFKRDKDGIPAKVAAIEYDPNRTAFIALLHYRDGEKRYIICPRGLKEGMEILSGEKVEPELGNCMPLKSIPPGSTIHNVEMQAGKGGQLARSAGAEARLLGCDSGKAVIQLPSGEVRRVPEECRATLGQVGNLDYKDITWGKAGRRMIADRTRPITRGMAKNPVDHPMGGGAARRKGHIPQSPSGVLAKGGKTRKPKARTNKQIIRRRKGAAKATV